MSQLAESKGLILSSRNYKEKDKFGRSQHK